MIPGIVKRPDMQSRKSHDLDSLFGLIVRKNMDSAANRDANFCSSSIPGSQYVVISPLI